ncbi:hypothetical protein [Aquibacillus saliphilus]|uniref:hypothetical protein n=1 Tax=Aquibacillus saliphilus TaxID=1909422 RepID=UPI001CF0AA9C|nr:hypothetical protein [Aquibacillus saliphilus]
MYIDIILNRVLDKLNLKNIKQDHITRIGEGAWHTVYKLDRIDNDDLVLRIKKKRAYGEIQHFDENELITEYESTRAYYKQANKSFQNICPTYFKYFIERDLVFTAETYMGNGQELSLLKQIEAFAYGKKLGQSFNQIHRNKPEIKGFGDLHWNGKYLSGGNHQKIQQIWEKDNNSYLKVLDSLYVSKLNFNREIVSEKVKNLIENRRKYVQTISLVNQDITPENLIVSFDRVSIIDPLPKLDFDLKYAAYFVFCYQFLLPSYSNSPRYLNNAYEEKRSILNEIAVGFKQGYFYNCNSDEHRVQLKRLKDEYILWMLLETFEHYEVLNKTQQSDKVSQQMGSKEVIRDRLDLCLDELEILCS